MFLRIQRRLLTLGLWAVAWFSACSGEHPPAASIDLGGGGPRAVGSSCETGDEAPCSITLGSEGGTLECYHGTQHCEDGVWGACGDGEVSEQALLAQPQGTRPLALSDPESCVNNPCNPSCHWYDEEPETPVDGVAGPGSVFDWDAGSLADLPGAVVQRALDEPCETALDCQFNTRCENPAQGTCAHSVCESGIALSDSCSECAALVFGVAQEMPGAYGQCFDTPPAAAAEECVHDPCTAGAALKRSCAASVNEVCGDSEYAACCSEAWTQDCVDRLREADANACECGVGEVPRDGSCLFHSGAGLSWTEAQNTCRNLGSGWDLAWIEDANESAFIHDTWGNPDGLWIGLNDREQEGTWSWSGGALSGTWSEATGGGVFANWCGANGPPDAPACANGADEPSAGPSASCASVAADGGWVASDCSDEWRASVCKGPPQHSATAGSAACAAAGEYFTDWFLGSPGAVGTINHTFQPGDYVITLVAMGEYAGNDWPDAQLRLNGTTVRTFSVESNNWQSYSYELSVDEAGSVAVSVRFPNDYYNASTGADRNLFVHSISIDCVAGPAVPTWGEECIGIAESACDISCSSSEASATTGACVPWLPGETDAACPDLPDLALGVPCSGSVPVCNHGQEPAPAGVTVVSLPETAEQFGAPNPDLSGPDVVRCETREEIPPGQCITLSESDCDGPLDGVRDVMVNPPGAGAASECSSLDNWAILVDSVECGVPACFGGSTAATSVRRPVDIVFVIDNSSSMQEEIAEVERRINEDFAAIIEASGLDYRVIMVSLYGDADAPFGTGGGASYPICIASPLGSTPCTDPNNEVPNPSERFFHYSARVGSNDALCLLIDGFSVPDELGVTSRPGWQVQAPNGFGAWLRPDAFKSFVVITDDNARCTTTGGLSFDDRETNAGGTTVADRFDTALRALSPAQFENERGERNYIWHSIVNMPLNDPPDEPWPAEDPISLGLCSGANGPYVGPGSGYQALSRLTGGLRYPSCRASDFDAVFNAIAEQVIDRSTISCSFEVDANGSDLDKARVSYTAGDDTKVEISQVANVDSCAGGGWHLDGSADDGTLTVNLCPTTCQEIQGDGGAQLFVEFPCELSFETTIYSQVYTADCEPGSIVEWRALGYDTSIEGNGSVEFEVRTAVEEDELDAADYVSVNTATSTSPDCVYLEPMECVASDPDCTCVAVDGQSEGIGGGVALVGNVLDSVAAHEPYLELKMTVLPDEEEMASPSVLDWKVAYSCLPGE